MRRNMPRQIDPETKSSAIKLYMDTEQNLSLTKVGRLLRISAETVRHVLIERNVPRKPVGGVEKIFEDRL